LLENYVLSMIAWFLCIFYT